MTLATQPPEQVLRPDERGVPVLETERLVLRAPRRGDVKAIVRLVNDRRIAENTARIPHPYGIDDAERFIAAVNRQDGEATFVITLGGELIGVCGVEPREERCRNRLLARRALLGPRLRHRGGARDDRSCLRRARP